MTRNWTESEIAAWVDGALETPAEAARIARIVETEPEAARTAERLRASNRQLRAAFDSAMREPVPPAIAAALDAVPARAAARGARPGPLRRRPLAAMAAAATIAFALGLGTGLMSGDRREPAPVAGLGPQPADAPLSRALEALPSGTVSQAGIRPMLTFRDAGERPCREFEVAGDARGIACRSGAGRWAVEILVAAPEAAAGGADYVPASGPAEDALGTVLDALGAGPALSPDAEAELISTGWGTAPG